jgi:hypothetical protein
MGPYRRLLGFLRPHGHYLAGNVTANVISAVFDGVAFVLLIPFLNVLFGTAEAIPLGKGWLTDLGSS